MFSVCFNESTLYTTMCLAWRVPAQHILMLVEDKPMIRIEFCLIDENEGNVI